MESLCQVTVKPTLEEGDVEQNARNARSHSKESSPNRCSAASPGGFTTTTYLRSWFRGCIGSAKFKNCRARRCTDLPVYRLAGLFSVKSTCTGLSTQKNTWKSYKYLLLVTTRVFEPTLGPSRLDSHQKHSETVTNTASSCSSC